jgi:integrase
VIGAEITPSDADQYKQKLVGDKLASMTIRKRLQFATMIFRAALRRRLIAESPFAEVTIKAGMPDRSRFITRDETQCLLDACPNNDWRLIIALARYGGLRCPSEVLSLRWQDVDWTAGKITVQSPKTEHHPGKATRTIPLFPELREHLQAGFDPQVVYVVDERMRASAQGKAGWRNCNLRTQFERIVKRAGLTPWPRLFHNLRSSRQTELAESFPSHVVCDWLGNSEDIARKHYYQVTADHFAEALSNPREVPQAADGAKSGAQVAQIRAQQAFAGNGGERHESSQSQSPQRDKRNPAKPDEKSRRQEADGEGFEPPVAFRLRQFSRLLP